jgi:hypothetical protein
MAIPWLIGIAAVAVAAALASDDDNSSSSSNDREREARRREEAERERAENERKNKLQAAHKNFAMQGERIGLDVAQSLHGWIEVNFEQYPAFSVKLNSRGYKIENAVASEQSSSNLIPSSDLQLSKIHDNLKIYSDIYKVKMKEGVNLIEARKEIETIESELQKIRQLKAEMRKLQSHLSTKV